MNAWLYRASLAALLVATLSTAARADRLIHVGFGGGFAIPTGTGSDSIKTGVEGRAYVLIQPPGFPFAIRTGISLQRFGIKNSSKAATMLGGNIGARLSLPTGRVRPYVTVAVGAFKVDGLDPLHVATPEGKETKLELDAGVGSEIRFSEQLNGFIEAKFYNVYTDKGWQGANSARFIPISFGLIF